MGFWKKKEAKTEKAKIMRIWRDESPGAMKYYGWFVLFEGEDERFKVALSRKQAKKWVDYWAEGDVFIVEHKGGKLISCRSVTEGE